MKNCTLPCAIALVFVLATLSSFAQSEKTKTFNGVTSIQLNTSSGDCKVQKSADASVKVYVRTTDDFDKNVDLSMEQQGDKLTIKEDHHSGNSHGSANWTISVPDGVKVKLYTGSGNLTIADVAVDVKGVTGSGDLEFTKVKGTINLTTGSGDLLIQESSGDIRITTGSGSAVVENSQGDINLTCGSGNIRANNSKAAFKLVTGSGQVSSKNITLTGTSSFTSGSGNTSVVLAASPQHNISVSSGSGDAQLDFNGNNIVGEVVMQADKKNGSISAPFDFDKVEEEDQGHGHINVKKTAVKGNSNTKIRVSTGSGDAVLRK